jgi:AmiR/NasT family two-component response regulator
MERYKIDADQAFNVMRRVSQDNNTKLIRVADELVRTRRTPG